MSLAEATQGQRLDRDTVQALVSGRSPESWPLRPGTADTQADPRRLVLLEAWPPQPLLAEGPRDCPA
jgi:hypothetical protein